MFEAWFGFALLTALTWGVDPILVKIGLAGQAHPGPMTALAVRLCGAIMGALVFLLTQPGLVGRAAALPATAIAALLVSGILGAVVGHMTNFTALNLGGAARVMPVQLAAAPAVTLLLAMTVLREPFSWRHLAGLLLVAAGVVLLAWRHPAAS